ncbi:MAG: hypothetical protein AUK47_28760 [Deltaproteobacteria bacterium CG2_30_63_29]|nr:MAG: hypothetical protein AUK47_28760 [Deltaproteobacteria bacterium CG2_30_63_29]
MSTGGSGGAMSEINVTPLVDVMLVLLIIFMVAAPLIEREHSKQELQENRDLQQRLVTLNLPVLDKTLPAPEVRDEVTSTKLTISATLAVGFEGKPVADCSEHVRPKDKAEWTECLDKTQAALTNQSKAKEFGVVIDADPTVPFGFVVGVIDRMHRLEITKVGMLPRR